MLELNAICKRYRESIVVDDVTLRIPEGGITALIGPNGAGKSTLFSMISRLLPPSSGQVLLDKSDVTRMDSRKLAKQLAVLRQDNHLPMKLTVRDLVAFGRHPHSQGRLTKDDEFFIKRAITYMHLDHLADRYLDEMSGGERQRAFVAMVLCQDTEYVLLDEPLNSLDIKQSVSMMKTLRRAADELGKTLIIVLHDINFASCYADHIIAMRQGKVAFQGESEALMRPDVLSAIYDTPMAVHDIQGARICVFYEG
ncbi:ATP-binding cassette domain-containing protein [Pseudomonas aeruginosa]|uniref:iron ABC transporter ATP-binding protein n=1 Tax=Pseudomonas aeruginosa TaxID=287 RepID=UPI000EB01DBD|nr:ATP-binding cassette domain-containing protein [Pseudomonas aeruginosa]MCO2409897.1 ATP-binding cassette domain-containing protein [Pseudomonas aeruginosa]MCO3481903.1 ATP-binding cassette domain-containing protein [Pseudomonas aeruginosa]HBO1850788.1 ATP-binding cassette domain-containing protein [Pseudomonas aeruginosa]HCE7123647.1 ATP-binding cassette domain-containing protein [Pseudomonas aeruginosa]HCW0354246.1 ATP-binding cassette domain-containing protein [Pseudomonas aeruginosa]